MSTSSVYSDRMRCQSNANYKINIINQTWQLDTTQLKLGFVQRPDFDSTLQNPGSTTTHDPMTLWPYDPMIPWPMSFAKHINQFLECLFKKQHLWLHSNDSTSQLHHIISLQENISSMADRQQSVLNMNNSCQHLMLCNSKVLNRLHFCNEYTYPKFNDLLYQMHFSWWRFFYNFWLIRCKIS